MPHSYKKLFGLAKELGMSQDDLRAGAASYTGVASLRSLSEGELRNYEKKLAATIRRNWRRRRENIKQEFKPHETLGVEQHEFALDLVTTIFSDIAAFRAWLRRYHKRSHESFVDVDEMRGIIVAMQQMRARGYKCKK